MKYARVHITENSYVTDMWPRMTALEIYNRLLGGVHEGLGKTTTQRRLWALQIFRRQFSLRLPELLAEFAAMWPHWAICPRGVCAITVYYDRVAALFVRLETSCNPAALDAWRPMTKRSRNTMADVDRVVRRFLDTGYCKPAVPGRPDRPGKKASTCRNHKDKPAAYSPDLCSSCYQRLFKLKCLNVLTADAPQGLVDAALKLPAVRGRGSTFLVDVKRLVADYAKD